jgi:O-antigen ligase
LYTLGAWAYGALGGWRAIAMSAVSAVLMFYVLISFRRTMWAAIALAFVLMLVWLPRPQRSRLLIFGAFVTLLLLGILALTPVGASLASSVAGRLQQTNVHDPSTLARLAIAVRVYQMFPDLPVLGFGVKPIWNEIASLGYFETSLENVHSLYYWWLLRTGYLGIIAMAVALALVASRLWRSKNQRQPQLRVLALCLMLGYLMVLVSGIFNPVYAETRYTVLVGIGLAMTSRLLSFASGTPTLRQAGRRTGRDRIKEVLQ